MWNSATTRTFQYNQNIIRLENPFQLCCSNNWLPSTVEKIRIVKNQIGQLTLETPIELVTDGKFVSQVLFMTGGVGWTHLLWRCYSSSNAQSLRRCHSLIDMGLLNTFVVCLSCLKAWENGNHITTKYTADSSSFKPKKSWCKVSTWR